jgi:hypothetical protein
MRASTADIAIFDSGRSVAAAREISEHRSRARDLLGFEQISAHSAQYHWVHRLALQHVRVASQKLGDGVWFIGSGSHNSLAVSSRISPS